MRRVAPLLVFAICIALPQTALGHAQVTGTEPARGAALEAAPVRVSFEFNEAVEARFGAVRVFDREGEQVRSGQLRSPAPNRVEVSLPGGLPDGAFTATYRVVSADAHPISGGFTFTVGDSAGTAAADVADLVDEASAGLATQAAFGVVRGLSYAAMAVLAGGLLFAFVAWAPAVARMAGGGPEWGACSDAFAQRLRRVLGAAALIGVATVPLAILLQGATAEGTSFWGALDTSVIHDVLATRFGTAWSLRLSAFAALGLALVAPAARLALPALRPASLGATGLAPAARPSWAVALPLVALGGLLLATPALSGHAGAAPDSLVLVPANVLHVVAMSAWVGGIAMLLAVAPRATRRLHAPDRTRLLAALLARFSTIALGAVALLLATGLVQSILQLESFGDLTATAFGRSILVKSALFLGLVGLGAHNRRRSIPRLERLAGGGEAPGGAGLMLRRALRAEIALMLTAIAVTAALVSYSPTAGAAQGPFAEARDFGAARLELTVEPARAGANEIHVYLFDRRDGSQYDRLRELTIKASLPDKEIGPLELDARKSGPGHYTVSAAGLVPAGEWELSLRGLINDFEANETKVGVPIR